MFIPYFVCLTGGTSKIINVKAAEDDPQRRKPDITKAKQLLKWEPRVSGVSWERVLGGVCGVVGVCVGMMRGRVAVNQCQGCRR